MDGRAARLTLSQLTRNYEIFDEVGQVPTPDNLDGKTGNSTTMNCERCRKSNRPTNAPEAANNNPWVT